jgi:uncharacterized protein YcbK (DUF882 family)
MTRTRSSISPLSWIRNRRAALVGALVATAAVAAPRAPGALARSAAPPHPTVVPFGATDAAAAPLPAASEAPGAIEVPLENVNTGEVATFSVGADGEVAPETRAALDRFFRCKRTGRTKPMSPQVLALVAAVAERFPGRVIEIVSGFRAPPYGAPHSKHFRGQAVDLRVRGIRTALVRDYLWRDHRGIGIGHYGAQNFLHVDVRPEEPDMAWSAAREGAREVYNPRWARRGRAPTRLAAIPLAAAR